jgi:dTDP-4-amino-4,6-dideoxygalactose transaminase
MPSAQRDQLPLAVDASAKVLCLPIYPDLEPQEQNLIIDLIVNSSTI